MFSQIEFVGKIHDGSWSSIISMVSVSCLSLLGWIFGVWGEQENYIFGH
jgi:hypothetical protein